MALTYLDASILVALFLDDAFGERADRALRHPEIQVIVSDFAAAEFASSVARHVRTREVTKREAGEAFADFDAFRDRIAGHAETTSVDVRSAETMLRRLDLSLRAPDALHIAIAQRTGAELATFDEKMAAAARVLGLSLANI